MTVAIEVPGFAGSGASENSVILALLIQVKNQSTHIHSAVECILEHNQKFLPSLLQIHKWVTHLNQRS